MSDLVVHFDENFIKIAPKITKLTADYIQVCGRF